MKLASTVLALTLFLAITACAAEPESVQEPMPALVQTPAPEPPAPEPAPESEPEPELEETPPPPPPEGTLPYMEILYKQSANTAGWLHIPSTQVESPVMHSPQEPERYLTRTFDGEDDPSGQGTPFIDGKCSMEPRDVNIIIHLNDTMFAELLGYQDSAFLKEHPVIRFSSLTDEHEYEIFAIVPVGQGDITNLLEDNNPATQEAFVAYIENIVSSQIYDTGIKPEPGDILITLVTTESGNDGRLAVIGRAKPDVSSG